MKTLRVGCLICLLFAITGCQTMTVEPVSAIPSGKKISRDSRIYIVTPEDGSYGGKPYHGSGSTVASAFDAALSRVVRDVIVGSAKESTDAAISAAKEQKCAYVLIPKITHWEDRATEWSGIRDKMNLFVKIIDVESGSAVASADIKGKSSWVTFGGDRPQDLVKAPVEEFVASLF